jgi:hypothetical protein
MRERWVTINWAAAFLGFAVDFGFSLLVGVLVSVIMLSAKGLSLESETWPPDVMLASQVVGVAGAVLGGGVAGFVARQRGAVHGVLASVIGLFATFCLPSKALDLGDIGFIVLNLIAAGYGGQVGERLRARRAKKP